SLQPRLPRDLETVCLKCLQKEPQRRYPSALELAEDLKRFLERRPVLARPVGTVERAVKWVRRRPLGAGVLAAVVLSLLGGIVVSAMYARRANREADTAQKKGREAEEKATEARRAQERAEDYLAAGLFRPLGHRAEGLNEFELAALYDLAA